MANFCVSCGNALNPGAGFCPNCGTRVGYPTQAQAPQPQPAQPQPPQYQATPAYQPVASGPVAAAPAKKSGSGLKIVLIAFLLFIAIGFAGIIGLYYYAKSKVHDKMAEIKARTGVDLPAAIDSAERSAYTSSRRSSTAGDACKVLTGAEAQGVLGFAIVKTSTTLNGSEESQCSYFADPEARRAAADKAAERANELSNERSSSKEEDLKKVEDVVKSIGASANDGSVPIMQVTIYRGNAKVAVTAFNLGTTLMGARAPRVEGPWDEGLFGPMNSTFTFRKGDNGAMIDLRQIPQGHDRGLELAKIIAARL